ncbi:DUF4383 domain-containing protein [Methylocystis sp. B8]|uniref:DUF4383 domain-containing protein n=1 Tax=Methylocystis sp. B8 TaxID=544938 RepID=UPI0010FED32D|nr:DUF4383 domain-containing protein [Methylocystis sp. B8]TLG74077.1 DUF4383 domain-containing protein [Methylocystis sp. B8]
MIETHWNANFIATILGVIFVAVGLLGFIPNPLVYDGGFFHVNAAHNFVRLITGALLLLSPYFGVPVVMIRVLAIVYAAVAILGFIAPNVVELGGLIAMNVADQWLHAAVAVVLLAIGFAQPMEHSVTTAHM